MSMHIDHLPVSTQARPTCVSPEVAEQALFDALAAGEAVETKREYFENKWIDLLAALDDGDQLWMFETSGIGATKRKGLARERQGEVVDILVFP